MASKDVSGNIGRMALFTCPSHNRAKLKAIVANVQAADPRTVYIRDVFTPAATNGTAAPSAITKNVVVFTAASTNHTVLDYNQLGRGGLVCLGAVDCSTNKHDGSMNIVVIYDFEGGE